MRVFVSEYVCSGAWPDDSLDHSLAVEGRAMLVALVSDLLQIPDCQVWTTWDRRLGRFPQVQQLPQSVGRKLATIDSRSDRLTVLRSDSPSCEAHLFRQVFQECDAAIVIAPEFEGILERRAGAATCLTRLIGCRPDAIRLCGDKLDLVRLLNEVDIAAVPTEPFDLMQPIAVQDEVAPWVVKPRDGAGSLLTFQGSSAGELECLRQELTSQEAGVTFVRQPFVSGISISCAAIVAAAQGAANQRQVLVLPPAEQIVSHDGTLRYLGADYPGRLTPAMCDDVRQTVRRCCASIDGLCGYVGFDLIIPDGGSTDRSAPGPLVIEINPRLTTGYLLWRQLISVNLAEVMLADRIDPDLAAAMQGQSAGPVRLWTSELA